MGAAGPERIGNSSNFDGGVPRTPAVSESDIGEKNLGCVESLERVTPPCNVGRRLAWGNVQFAENLGVDGDKPFIVPERADLPQADFWPQTFRGSTSRLHLRDVLRSKKYSWSASEFGSTNIQRSRSFLGY